MLVYQKEPTIALASMVVTSYTYVNKTVNHCNIMLQMVEWTITLNEKHSGTEQNSLLLSTGIKSYRVISRLLYATLTRYQISVRQLLIPYEESRIVASTFTIYINFKVKYKYII